MNCRNMISGSKLLSITIALTCFAVSGATKTGKDLDQLDQAKPVDVIVQFNHVATDQDHLKVATHGGKHKRSLNLVNGAVYSMTPRPSQEAC